MDKKNRRCSQEIIQFFENKKFQKREDHHLSIQIIK